MAIEKTGEGLKRVIGVPGLQPQSSVQIISNKNKPNLDSQKNGNFKKFAYGFKTYG